MVAPTFEEEDIAFDEHCESLDSLFASPSPIDLEHDTFPIPPQSSCDFNFFESEEPSIVVVNDISSYLEKSEDDLGNTLSVEVGK